MTNNKEITEALDTLEWDYDGYEDLCQYLKRLMQGAIFDCNDLMKTTLYVKKTIEAEAIEENHCFFDDNDFDNVLNQLDVDIDKITELENVTTENVVDCLDESRDLIIVLQKKLYV